MTRAVGLKAIGGQLEAAGRGDRSFSAKPCRIACVAPAKVPGQESAWCPLDRQ